VHKASTVNNGNGEPLVHKTSVVNNGNGEPLVHKTSVVNNGNGAFTSSILKCFYTNAESVINKRSELLTVKECESPDIISVTEILHKESVWCELTLRGQDSLLVGTDSVQIT
jgi:hypothetical protein